MQIIPAIIPEDFEDLKEKLSFVKGLVSSVQVDITDGVFVPSKSWPFNIKKEENFEKIINQEEGMPFWEDFDFEFDLMVQSPESSIEDWVNIGARRVVVHIESTEKLPEIINILKDRVEIGVAININTDLEEIYPFVDKIDFVQFMGIEKIGFQGQSFSKKVLDKIREFRKKYPDVIISIDGGVGLDNAKDLVKAGADRLVSGSAIFESSNIKEVIETFGKI